MMDLYNHTAHMNASLILTVFYGDLHPDIVEELRTKIILQFEIGKAIELNKEKHLEITVK